MDTVRRLHEILATAKRPLAVHAGQVLYGSSSRHPFMWSLQNICSKRSMQFWLHKEVLQHIGSIS